MAESLDFLNPLEKIAFRMALRNKDTRFVAKNVTLTMDYDRRPGFVWFKTTKGFVPCGWIAL